MCPVGSLAHYCTLYNLIFANSYPDEKSLPRRRLNTETINRIKHYCLHVTVYCCIFFPFVCYFVICLLFSLIAISFW